jgi:uncharacterized protein YndB with AHSA1/START domain
MTTNQDRIAKSIYLRAPRSRVWRALTNAKEFGTWFRARFEGEVKPGARLRGQLTYAGYEHVVLEIVIEQMQPESLFSYRWHPNAIDTTHDYSAEASTLVEFHLKEIDGGTQLELIESGFSTIPAARRAEAFRSNSRGWATQLENIERHVQEN